VLITVGADERIYVDNEPLGASELAGWLKDAKKKNPDLQLQLSADKKASYGTIVAVIDAARAADIQNVTAFTAKSLK
jgi:biopolymer transport protein ExbD